MAEGVPILVWQLYVQHLCQPYQWFTSIKCLKFVHFILIYLVLLTYNLLGKQDGEESEAAHTPRFSSPTLSCSTDTLYKHKTSVSICFFTNYIIWKKWNFYYYFNYVISASKEMSCVSVQQHVGMMWRLGLTLLGQVEHPLTIQGRCFRVL